MRLSPPSRPLPTAVAFPLPSPQSQRWQGFAMYPSHVPILEQGESSLAQAAKQLNEIEACNHAMTEENNLWINASLVGGNEDEEDVEFDAAIFEQEYQKACLSRKK